MMNKRYLIGSLFLFSTMTHASSNPIAWEIISEALPEESSLYSIYHTTYQFTSQLPFIMPTPFMIHAETSTDEFVVTDNCSHTRLKPGEHCTVTVMLNPEDSGDKSAGLTMQYGDTYIPLPVLKTLTAEAAQSWTGTIGVDYKPNHYPNNFVLNDHDVFFAGSNAQNQPMTNVYAELAQLQAAGFNTVRAYETVEYSWIDIINQAHALNMNVVYEAVIPQNGNTTDINAAVSVLSNVIDAVGIDVFKATVSLVFAGHENYCDTCNAGGSNITYLTSAVSALQQELSANTLSTPVGSALLSASLVTPSSPSNMQTLINSYSASAPLAFDPYPFQWGVPIASAVSSPTSPQTINSIAWDYEQVMLQSFYASPRPILMAETGWATQGVNTGYFCYNNISNPCEPSIDNAATYLSALYAYVRDASNESGALVFEAYDEPAKVPGDPNNAENFYGMFDSNCNLKNNDTTLLPNTAYSDTDNEGCQGFAQGALFVAVGSVENQPPFTVEITQQSPAAGQNASMSIIVPTTDRTNTNMNPWPNFLVFNNASIELIGSSGAVCTGTATVTGSPPALTLPASLNCTTPYVVNCLGVNCFLPGDF